MIIFCIIYAHHHFKVMCQFLNNSYNAIGKDIIFQNKIWIVKKDSKYNSNKQLQLFNNHRHSLRINSTYYEHQKSSRFNLLYILLRISKSFLSLKHLQISKVALMQRNDSRWPSIIISLLLWDYFWFFLCSFLI